MTPNNNKPKMETPKPSPNLFSFLHHHCRRCAADLAVKFETTRQKIFPPPPPPRQQQARRQQQSPLHFASLSQGVGKHAFDVALSTDGVAKRLAGTALYTVSNSNNEFVLISDPTSVKSIGLLCFRQEDAESFLAQVRLRKGELRGPAKVVPISLDQVYMLKVEGIAFRFLPDPVQIKNALELRASETRTGFDGVPVFQSDLLVVKRKNKRYCPIYFRREDIEKELSMVSRAPRGSGVSQHIMVGTLEDVLKKMETSENNSGWEDLIFVLPGKSRSQHIQEVVNA